MIEGKDIAKDVLEGGIEKSANATFKWGSLQGTNKEKEVELRQHLRSTMLVWLGTVLLVMVPVGLFTKNVLYGFGAGLVVMGLYSLFTGRAVLKPGAASHSLFLGWKARAIGFLLLLFSALAFALGPQWKP